MRQTLRKRKPRLALRVAFLALCALIFTVPAKAQVYMHSGTVTVTASTDFYDSGGPSSADGSYFWEKFYSANENATLTFKNGTNPMKVTFNTFQAWDDTGWPDYTLQDLGSNWGLRINDDHLYIYDGEGETNLIAELTGNIVGSFSVMANGPITFKFVSNGQYQEEGWHATVTSAQTFTPQPPIITKDVCDDMVVLNNTTYGDNLYYTTTGNDPVVADPLTGAILYEGPFAIDLDANNASVTVKAVSYHGTPNTGTVSTVSSSTFTHNDQVPTPAAPTITIEGNTVTITPPEVPEGLNETYNVMYSTGNDDPLYGTLLTSNTGWSFEWTTPNTTFNAITVSVNCEDKISAVVHETFGNVVVPTPTIVFNNDGTATISCSMTGATIYYTTDGTTPTATNYTGTGTTSLTTAALTPGTTVYAYATFSGDGYTPSGMAHAIYTPEGGSGVDPNSGVVLLDDREEHTLSYYSDDTQPIHKLKPIDVKITYKGFGENTMTSASTANTPANSDFDTEVTADQVAVNVNEAGNQFIYLKTLENDKEDGSGNYPYTMIPNPFQVRPMYTGNRGGNGTMEKSPIMGNVDMLSLQSLAPTEAPRMDRGTSDVTYEKVTSSQSDWSGTYLLVYDYSTTTGYAFSGVNSNNYTGTYTSVTKTNSGNTIASPGSAALLTLAPYSEDNSYYTIQINNGNYLYSAYSGFMTGSTATNGTYTYEGSTQNYYCYYNVSYSNGTLYINCPQWASSGNFYYIQFNTSSNYFIEQLSGQTGYSFPSLYKETNSGGGSTCEDFESYYSIANTSISTNSGLPSGWSAIFTGSSSGYTPHLYRGNYALDGVGIVMTSGSSTYGNNNYVISNITLRTGNEVSFNAYREASSTSSTYGTLTYGYMTGTTASTFVALGTANTEYYYNGSATGGANSFTVPAAANGYKLAWRWSLSSSYYSVVIDNVCVSGGYTVTYNANGGSGTMTDPNSPYEEGSTVTVMANSFTAPQYKVFNGWNTAANGSGTNYSAGNTFTITENTTLYAQWVDDGIQRYTVTVANMTNGSVTANPTRAQQGETVNLTITPSTGYSLSSITVMGNTSGNTVTLNGSGNSRSFTMPGEDVTVTATFFNPADAWRGFYAWRVKKLSSGLSITDSDGNNYGVNSIIYADQEIEFVATGNSKDNEVEFEALWAKAYVNSNSYISNGTGNYANYKNAYERNFKVGTTITTYSYPVTFSTLNPDGSGTVGTVNQGTYTCSNDVKFENMTINGATNATYTSAGYSLIFGRGISKSGAINRVCGYTTSGGSATVNTAVAYTIRLESGTFNEFDLLNNTGGQFGSTVKLKAVIGSDYDRAKKDNEKLDLAPSGAIYGKSNLSGSYGVSFTSSSNRNNITFDWYVKSGQIQRNLLGSAEGGDQSIYLGHTSNGDNGQYTGKRRMTIEGGEMASIAGGVTNCGNNYTTYAVNDGEPTVLIRMKGGTVRGAIYGAGEYGGASGERRFVITNGTVNGWIAGGCNGTHNDGGELFGMTYIYVGGKAKVIPSSDDPRIGGYNSSYGTNGAYGGYIFGAGCGLAPVGFDETSANPNWTLLESNTVGKVFGSRIVIADECEVGRDIYGGGNFGFVAGNSGTMGLTNNTDMKTEIYILGGTVRGDVQGGSNNSIGQTVNIFVRGGELVGRTVENPQFPNDSLEGSVYGGSDSWGVINGVATIEMTGGHVHGSVFGGGYGVKTDMKAGTVINIKGGTIDKNVYGGGEEGTVSGGNTDVNISGGTMANVYGAGRGEEAATGSKAVVTGKTYVDVTGGTVSGSVYGGGEAGNIVLSGGGSSSSDQATVVVTLSGSTSTNRYINISYTSGGQTITQTVYWQNPLTHTYYADYGTAFSITGKSGAGQGTRYITVTVDDEQKLYTTLANLSTPWTYNIPAQQTPEPSGDGSILSYVTINGGTVGEHVFGGGKLGKTYGAVQTNMEGGIVRGNVYGGALGEQKKVYVNGRRTVNVLGGHVYGNVYGGSRNANDAFDMEISHEAFASSTDTATICVTNISGGVIDENVYAAGYYGNTFGSVYAFIGKNAIEKAPRKKPSEGTTYKVATLSIGATVWAGGDWGVFEGEFGSNTISGNSNIYVDGTGYETETNQSSNAQYMNIGGSILGCGTSCHAGKGERTIIVRNYGHDNGTTAPANATRSLYSIQFAKILIFDNAHINFTGQGKVNSLITTEQYAIQEIYDDTKSTNVDTDIDGVRIVNGSGLFMNAPVTQIANFRSMSCSDVYATTELDAYTVIMPSTLSGTPNKVRVNNGNYIEVKYGNKYCALIGYSYMMSSNEATDGTCAYARPRWCTGASFNQGDTNYDNPDDGGWVSYDSDENTFALDGTNPGTIQMPYENHTVRNGEDYFRIWRVGGIEHYREGVFDAYGNGTTTYSTTDVTISLPAFRDRSNYYRFQTIGDGNTTSIDYGADVLTFNAANYDEDCLNGNWMYYNEDTEAQVTGLNQNNSALEQGLSDITSNADVNFGLVIMPSTGLGGSNYIICMAADENLANNATFTDADDTEEPEVIFRLTYYNMLSTNMQWEPSTIVLEQCHDEQKTDDQGNPLYYDEFGNETTEVTDTPVIITTVTDIVTISLAVSTRTSIEQTFTTEVYAIMQGKGSTSETYTAKVVLPMFNVYTSGQESNFTVQSIDFAPANDGELVARATGYDYDRYAVGYNAAFNYDNTDGWNAAGNYTEQDSYPLALGGGNSTSLGHTGGRAAFAIDFTLHYDGSQEATEPLELIGTLTYHIVFDNYKDADGNEVDNQPLTIIVKVYRRGPGSKFYIDGINGSNAYDAHHPDQAVRSLSTIFNRCGYIAGDEIYIVDTVKVNKALTWNGLPYENVTIYRYNGGHELATEQGIIGNSANTAYTGALLYVTNTITMQGITLDGYYNDGQTTYTTTTIDPETGEEITEEHTTDPNGGPHTVSAVAPMVSIADGGKVGLNNGTVLRNNYNSTNGGAVAINSGGTLMMNHDAQITGNSSANDGAGVYMAGTLIVSDDVKIYDNMKGDRQNNVFLTAADKVVTIGTEATGDAYGPLSADAQIGVTKTLYADVDGYTRVVNVQSTADIDWLETPYNSTPNAIIFHDLRKYELVKFSDPTYLYWIGTWVTVQDWNPHYTSADAPGYNADDFEEHLDNIDTPEELAWLISYVNGLNGASEHHDVDVVITADIDMDASIWVPIGVAGDGYQGYTGTFDGNGHVITGMRSPLTQVNMAMFGATDGNADIKDFVAKVNFSANSQNIAAVAAKMYGNATISNVEAAGVLAGGSNTVYMGGLVADAQDGTIHSCFAVDTLTGGAATQMGGLVAHNAADLYNSYANVALGAANAATEMGGLVGVNEGHVENCYVINPIGPAFAYSNITPGVIKVCYAANGITNYVGEGSTGSLTEHGNYDAVLDRKAVGYMYNDNKVTASNDYVINSISYVDDEGTNMSRITRWPGLLSTLNRWVEKKSTSELTYTSWFRPTSADINGDLPILGFGKDNSFATEDGRFLWYAAFNLEHTSEVPEEDTFDNGLDMLLTKYTGKDADIFLYGAATEVSKTPSDNVNVYINEDAVLIQDDGAEEFRNATVGVTFDNSSKKAHDFWGDPLNYDWHLMSTPLANAALGITYGDTITDYNYWNVTDKGQAVGVSGSYMPDMEREGMDADWEHGWDFYTYYEPQYHWINFKRNINSHHHYEEPHSCITYTGMEQTANAKQGNLIPGRGYMMAIDLDSYLSNSGALNRGKVTMPLTVSGDPENDPAPTKDWGSNLVGNPYQAYLDLAEVANGNGFAGYSQANGFYVYDADNGTYGPYITNASVNPAIPSQYIHPHQAFFVVTNEPMTLTFDDQTMATTTSNPTSYFRGEEQPRYPVVNLFAENRAGNRDMTVIELNRPELGGLRKVENLRNANFKISAHLGGQNYGLVFTPEDTEKVPVHFKVSESGVYTLTWSTYNGDFTSLRLIDNKTGVNYDMLANNSYTFEASADDYASRFYITYNVIGVDENVNEVGNSFAFFNGSEWVINGKGHLDVIDVTGRVLYAAQLNNDQNRVHLDGVAKGVYLLRVVDNKVVRTQKIIVR